MLTRRWLWLFGFEDVHVNVKFYLVDTVLLLKRDLLPSGLVDKLNTTFLEEHVIVIFGSETNG